MDAAKFAKPAPAPTAQIAVTGIGLAGRIRSNRTMIRPIRQLLGISLEGFVMRQRLKCLVTLLAVLYGVASAAFAHHSVVGEFDRGKTLTLKGTISKVSWMNPHIYVYVDVKEADGTVSNWALETLPTAMMRKAGLTKEAVMGTPGEIVSVNIIPARDGTKHLGWISKITYSDGRYYELGGTGPIQ